MIIMIRSDVVKMTRPCIQFKHQPLTMVGRWIVKCKIYSRFWNSPNICVLVTDDKVDSMGVMSYLKSHHNICHHLVMTILLVNLPQLFFKYPSWRNEWGHDPCLMPFYYDPHHSQVKYLQSMDTADSFLRIQIWPSSQWWRPVDKNFLLCDHASQDKLKGFIWVRWENYWWKIDVGTKLWLASLILTYRNKSQNWNWNNTWLRPSQSIFHFNKYSSDICLGF